MRPLPPLTIHLTTITIIRLEIGCPAIGSEDGLLTAGEMSGFQATGGIGIRGEAGKSQSV